MIKAVIFDYGNVISMPQVETSKRMEAFSHIPASVFDSVYEKFRFEFDRGTITGAQMYRQALDAAGYHEQARDETLVQTLAKRDMESWARINDEVTAWGLELKAAGYKLGILSNMPTEFLDAYEKDIALFTAADFACFSCRVRLIKPEEGIYRAALAGLHIEPEEAVFFDDLRTNVEAANRFGIHGILWTGLADAKKAWNGLVSMPSSKG
jgi:putative hydrolase of the HAD superfamily